MPAVILLGAQWGDEGKGKATDLLGDRVDYVVRYQGGNNAGHTVVIAGEKYALHLLPSGVLTRGVIPVIGNGVVVDPAFMLQEIDYLAGRDVDTSKLLVSGNAHLIMPHHKTLDRVTERFLGKAQIGTTGRGIGPAYGDKVARQGVRVQDLFDPGIMQAKLELALREKNQVLTKVYNRKGIDVQQVVDEYLGYADRIRPYVTDTSLVLDRALRDGKVVLLEGGQGTLLDVDHGSYPFVTSSNPTAGGACAGAGIGPTHVSRVIGILKAYTTRVGSGPFPTELLDEMGERLRNVGGEFGVTTGRNRRCGWFDAVIARYATPGQRPDRLLPHQARRAVRARADPGLRRLPRRWRGRGRDAGVADRLPPRGAGLRGAPGLVGGHHRGEVVRRPAEERAELRKGARGHERSADLGDRGGPGPRADARAPVDGVDGSPPRPTLTPNQDGNRPLSALASPA
jgi:adenylosuccinate synthase